MGHSIHIEVACKFMDIPKVLSPRSILRAKMLLVRQQHGKGQIKYQNETKKERKRQREQQDESTDMAMSDCVKDTCVCVFVCVCACACAPVRVCVCEGISLLQAAEVIETHKLTGSVAEPWYHSSLTARAEPLPLPPGGSRLRYIVLV